VRFRPGTSGGQRAAVRSRHGLERVEGLPLPGLELVRIRGRGSPPEVAGRVSGETRVRYAEPNHLWYPDQVIPNDPEFGQLWGLHNTGQTVNGISGTADADIDAPEGWEVAADTSDVVVGVIDTGIDIDHPDLAGRIWTNPGEIPGNGVDDDGNGYPDDVHGWDFHNNDSSVFDPTQPDDHGTHVAGTIAAVMDNATDVAGVSEAQIMPLKFLGPRGGDTANAVKALDYAIDEGAHLTNNSWGGGGFNQALKDKIDQAGDAGQLFIAAAGNGGSDGVGDNVDQGNNKHYPASYPNDNVMAVAATTSADGLASFSNYGSTSVDLGAPGSSILSTVPRFAKAVLAGPDTGGPSYRSAFHSFGLEGVTPASKREAILSAALGWMGVPSTGSVLVVDDDGGQAFQTAYQSALSASGFTNVTTVTVSTTGNCGNKSGPSAAVMSGHAAVIWFTGSEAQCTVNATDRSNLTTYLGGGAGRNLLLFGQDIGFNLTADGTQTSAFLANTLRVDYVADYDVNFRLSAVPGTPYSGVGSVQLNGATPGGTTPQGQRWSSAIAPRAGAVAGLRGGWTTWFNGTSMATPHVSGAAAHLLAGFPAMTHLQAKQRLMDTGDSLPALAGKTVSGKRLNLASALAVATPGAPSSLTATPRPAGRIDLSWTAPSGPAVAGYNVYRSTSSGFVPGPGNRLNGSPVAGTAYQDTATSDGTTYHYVVRAVNGEGTESGDSNAASATADATAPQTIIDVKPASVTNQTTATFEFSSNESGSTFQCSLDGGAFATCGSPKTYSGLGQGSHIFEARAVDPAGNVDASPASWTWTVDSVAPDTTILSKPPALTNGATATLSFSSTEAGSSFECRLDDAPTFSPCSTPKEYTDLSDGSHTFRVRATDPAGNVDPSPAAWTWTVDLTQPGVSGTSPADGATGVAVGTNVSTTFSEPMDPATLTGSNVRLRPQGSTTDVPATLAYDGPSRTATLDPSGPLAHGQPYVVEVTTGVKDLAGNQIPAAVSWTFTTVDATDVSAPSVIISEPEQSDVVASRPHAITGEAADPGGTIFEVRVAIRREADGKHWNGTAFATTTEVWLPASLTGTGASVGWSFAWEPPTADSQAFTVRARAEDAGGNLSAVASRGFLIDNVAPTGTLSIQAGATATGTRAVTLSLTGSDGSGTPQVRVGNGTGPLTGPFTALTPERSWMLADGADGPRTVSMQLRDAAGNESEVIGDTIVLDRTPPSGTALTAPTARFQRQRGVRVAWTASDAGSGVAGYDVDYRQARFDGGWSPWRSWLQDTASSSATFQGRPGFTYRFRVRARDGAGNESSGGPVSTAVPMNDRQLTRNGAWSSGTHAGAYLGTFTRTSERGATLVRTGVVTRHLALVVTRCPRCGSVEVWFGGSLLRTVSLRSDTVQRSRVVSIQRLPAVQRGRVEVRVRSSGKPVPIEGLGTSRT
jgi:subtilisin family serine protease